MPRPLSRLLMYGTLKRGERWHSMLGEGDHRPSYRALYVGATWVHGYTLFTDGNIPMMVESIYADVVHGELYDVPRSLLKTLDQFEWLYERRNIAPGAQTPIWSYIWTRELKGLARIGSVYPPPLTEV